MTSKEYAIYQLKQLKGKPLKEKLEHILTYFWVPIVIVLTMLAFSVSMIVHYATMKMPVLSVCCVNAIAEENRAQAYLDTFLQKQEFDLNRHEATLQLDMIVESSNVSMNYDNLQLLQGMLGGNMIDAMAAPTALLLGYAYDGAFTDLTTVVDAQLLERLAPQLLYVDVAVLEALRGNDTEEVQLPDPQKPEEMERPVPVAILLSSDWDFTQCCYSGMNSEIAIALVANGENAANGQAFLKYLLNLEMENG